MLVIFSKSLFCETKAAVVSQKFLVFRRVCGTLGAVSLLTSMRNSRELFKSYLEDFDGIYSGAVNFDALAMEPADPSFEELFQLNRMSKGIFTLWRLLTDV